MGTKRTDEFRADERADTQAGGFGFGCGPIHIEQ
jgi:hypothetical protein